MHTYFQDYFVHISVGQFTEKGLFIEVQYETRSNLLTVELFRWIDRASTI